MASNPRKPERNFNTESIVNTSAIISKTITPVNDPIDANNENGDGDPIDSDEEYGDVELNKYGVTNSDATMNMATMLDKIVAIISYNDPFRKSCSA
jgi:hypothetical protein